MTLKKPLDDKTPSACGSLLQIKSPHEIGPLNIPNQNTLVCFSPPQSNALESCKMVHEVKSLQYFSVSITSPRQIELNVVDPSHHFLPKVLPGSKTFVKLNVKQDDMMDEYTVHMISDDSGDSNLKMKFPRPLGLSLDKNWYIALVSLNFPTTFLSPLSDLHRKIRLFKGSEWNDLKEYNIKLPKSVSSTRDLALELVHQTNAMIKVGVDNECLKFYKEPGQILQFVLSKTAAIYLGMNEVAQHIYGRDLGMDVMSLHSSLDSDWIFPNRPKLHENRPTFIKVHCPQIYPTLNSGIFEPILRSVPVRVREYEDSYISEEFHHLEFSPVSQQPLQEIDLLLLDPNNNPLKFDISRTMPLFPYVVTIL